MQRAGLVDVGSARPKKLWELVNGRDDTMSKD